MLKSNPKSIVNLCEKNGLKPGDVGIAAARRLALVIPHRMLRVHGCYVNAQ